MKETLETWLERHQKILEERELTREELDAMNDAVDAIANKGDQTELEVSFLTAWFLAELRAVENDAEKLDLSWAVGSEK